MASLTPTNSSVSLPCSSFMHKASNESQSLSLSGLPAMVKSRGVRCSIEEKSSGSSTMKKSSSSSIIMVASLMTAMTAAAGPAMALVDDRLSTEGTGLPFGLSNNLLGWILLGVFGLIWSLYFIYASSLEEDDDSGLSL